MSYICVILKKFISQWLTHRIIITDSKTFDFLVVVCRNIKIILYYYKYCLVIKKIFLRGVSTTVVSWLILSETGTLRILKRLIVPIEWIYNVLNTKLSSFRLECPQYQITVSCSYLILILFIVEAYILQVLIFFI